MRLVQVAYVLDAVCIQVAEIGPENTLEVLVGVAKCVMEVSKSLGDKALFIKSHYSSLQPPHP